uniref:Uncharacterized protein n=1 Tax=Rhizophora mucronata TaxID=61149 RepID=A0A2P2QEV5_RHIMU
MRGIPRRMKRKHHGHRTPQLKWKLMMWVAVIKMMMTLVTVTINQDNWYRLNISV